MTVHGIDHINIKAPSALLDDARAFYSHILGLDAGPLPVAGSGYWLYAGEHALIHLNALESASPGVSYYNHVAFRCSEPGVYLGRLEAEGITADVRTDATGQVRQIFFRDPFDLRVELCFPAAETPT